MNVSNEPIKITIENKRSTVWLCNYQAMINVVNGDELEKWSWSARKPDVISTDEDQPALMRDDITIKEMPVYWKWFPWLPTHFRNDIWYKDALILKVDGWTVEYPDGTVEACDSFMSKPRWRIGVQAKLFRQLDSMGYLFEYDKGRVTATLKDENQLIAALAMTVLFWYREVRSD